MVVSHLHLLQYNIAANDNQRRAVKHSYIRRVNIKEDFIMNSNLTEDVSRIPKDYHGEASVEVSGNECGT